MRILAHCVAWSLFIIAMALSIYPYVWFALWIYFNHGLKWCIIFSVFSPISLILQTSYTYTITLGGIGLFLLELGKYGKITQEARESLKLTFIFLPLFVLFILVDFVWFGPLPLQSPE